MLLEPLWTHIQTLYLDSESLTNTGKSTFPYSYFFHESSISTQPTFHYSFLLRKSTQLYNRRHAKIVTTLTSYFTSSYVFHWRDYFPDLQLKYPPSFDGRIVLYPSDREVKDYFAWRQVDSEFRGFFLMVFRRLPQRTDECSWSWCNRSAYQ